MLYKYLSKNPVQFFDCVLVVSNAWNEQHKEYALHCSSDPEFHQFISSQLVEVKSCLS